VFATVAGSTEDFEVRDVVPAAVPERDAMMNG
jgi:hypothetical protein